MLDTEFKFDMTIEEARDLGMRAIYHATHRDAYSGGVVNGEFLIFSWSFRGLTSLSPPPVYHVGENGWTKLGTTDVTELHYKFQADKRK